MKVVDPLAMGKAMKSPATPPAQLHSETDENDLTYFLLYHAEVVRRAVDQLHRYIEDRTRRLVRIQEELRGLAHLNYRQRDLINHALRHPGQRYTVEYHKNSHKVVYETARSDMMDLVGRGLLQRCKVGKAWLSTPAPHLEERLRQMG